MPGIASHLGWYLPLMPAAIEQLDLTGYGLVISSSHAVAKGVIVSPDALHLSYVHSPMRYAWDQQFEYLRSERAESASRGCCCAGCCTACGCGTSARRPASTISRRIRPSSRGASPSATGATPSHLSAVDTEFYVPGGRPEEMRETTTSRCQGWSATSASTAGAGVRELPDRRLLIIATGRARAPEVPGRGQCGVRGRLAPELLRERCSGHAHSCSPRSRISALRRSRQWPAARP